jgi:hypothetical protein
MSKCTCSPGVNIIWGPKTRKPPRFLDVPGSIWTQYRPWGLLTFFRQVYIFITSYGKQHRPYGLQTSSLMRSSVVIGSILNIEGLGSISSYVFFSVQLYLETPKKLGSKKISPRGLCTTTQGTIL